MSQLQVWRGVFIALIVFGLFPGWAIAQDEAEVPLEFSITQVVPPRDGWFYATELNNSGVVAGSGIGPIAGGDGDVFCNQAFVWSAGVATDIGARLGGCSHAYGVNDEGWVVGRYTGDDRRDRIFFMSPEQVIETPDFFEGHLRPSALNNARQSAGGKSALGSRESTAFLLDQGELVDLLPEGAVSSSAYGINDLGEVVGAVDRGEEGTRGFVWSGSEFTEIGDPGDRIAAVAINERSQVVLTAFLAGEGFARGFLLDGEDLIDLGYLNEGWTAAGDINDSGWIVGLSRGPVGIREHAYLWVDGVMYDLNDLISDDSPWELVWGVAVNDNFQILVRAIHEETGNAGYLLLTPESTEEVIEGLIDDVRELIDDGEIGFSRGRSLIAELQVALWFLQWSGGEAIAVIRMEHFILKVESAIRNDEVDPEIGAELIVRAEAIIELLQTAN